ncbi:NAD(P)H-binding protein [Streptomyces sp. BPTC-684]|uniref:NAD(P)H-binding protein n=1 Tax=Streptomyces sp. BPTC-684 TaxID=3043734 RepID=UPI0024B1327F|nr:NAD(P)H-binding protein [Streptomyces sp. BPTC-684]WHM40431.1 NAD(P)H-binding protein [Streptomyces sp. BPTC-684]
MTTLVIGARGSVGRQVLDQLLALGEPVRASARDPETADLPAGVPVVAADLTRPETLPAALDGVRKVFVYATAAGMADFAVAARAAGVEHVVVLSSGSVLLPYAHGNAIAEEHRTMERVLAASGLRWTPIRPLVLANNALTWSYSIRTEGVARMLHPEAATAPIHERDVAAAAVAALTGRAEGGVSDLLTGGELMSQRRQVELIGEAAGRTVRIEELTEARARREFERFGSPAVAASIVQFIVAAAQGGSPATGTARRILGRRPLPFAQWAADHAATFA